MRAPDRLRVRHARTILLRWYRRHSRELIWRTTRDPYEILVSEIMLQQTQVKRVQEKLPPFLKRFPTMRALASATGADVLRAWRGMGYNNRAIRLRDLARHLVNHHDARIPADLATLENLPGIGPYTAHALLCFAFKKRVPVVDVNIRRVLSRIFWQMRTPADTLTERSMWKFAAGILPRDSSTWNQALMDLGATICLARRPLCSRCPLQSVCRSSHLGAIPSPRPGSSSAAEPAHAGVPRRIWRGRIVEYLRSLNDHEAIPLRTLGRALKPGFRTSDLLWLHQLGRALEQDGIVTLLREANRTSIRLTDA